MIEKLARIIVTSRLEPILNILLPIYAVQPDYLWHMGFMMSSPILPFLGDAGERYFLLLKKEENVEKLRKRMKELKKVS